MKEKQMNKFILLLLVITLIFSALTYFTILNHHSEMDEMMEGGMMGMMEGGMMNEDHESMHQMMEGMMGNQFSEEHHEELHKMMEE